MNIKNNFKNLLLDKQVRENRLISVPDVAKETGTPGKTVQSWVDGNVSQYSNELIERWCKYFGCQVGDLLVYVPEES